MRPDNQKAVYGAKLVELLTEALRLAGVQGIEHIGHISNFQPFKSSDGRDGAFVDVGVWMAADANMLGGTTALEAINAAIIRAYYKRVTCCACKSDMSHNTHHWVGCSLKDFKAILQPFFVEVWEKAAKAHSEETNRRHQNRG